MRGPELPCMLKIEEEKRAIPCEKDTSVILAFLGSALKWFRKDIIQLSPEGEVNSSEYIPRREASRYISTALHRP